MTKILFIQDVLFDFHGLEVLSGVLKQHNHKIDVFTLDYDKEDVIDYIKRTGPDIVGFSISSTIYNWSINVAKRIKAEGLECLVIFGGPHPTYFPDFIENEFVDGICVGEGEYAMLELADNLEKGKEIKSIDNLYIKGGKKIYKNKLRSLVNLDELPMPDRTLYYKYKFLKNNPTKRFFPTRGCPYNCSYCYNQNYKNLYKDKGNYLRYLNIDKALDEIEFVRRNSNLKTVSIVADTFTTNKKWLFEFLDKYKERIGLPFYAQARVNELNEEVIKKLKDAGCCYISFGIESGNPEIRNLILNKNITNEQIIHVAELCRKYKLRFMTFNIFGLPNEGIEEAFDTVKLNAKIRADTVSATILQPQLGTRIYEFIEENNLFESKEDHHFLGHYEDSILKLDNKREIMNLQKLVYLGVKFPFIIPLLRVLIKLPPNLLFNLFHKFTLFMRYKNSRNYSWYDMMKVGWYLRKYA